MKLHLGCGAVTPPGWVNVDASWNARLAKFPFLRSGLRRFKLAPSQVLDIPWSSSILIHDVRKPLPFPDRSATTIYASHLLYCLHLKETQRLLKECLRVLRPQGILRVMEADIRSILKEYGEFPSADRLSMRLCYPVEIEEAGFLYRFYKKRFDLLARKWLYDGDSLIAHFVQAGFTEVMERRPLESQIDGIEEVEKNWGICVEGIRP